MRKIFFTGFIACFTCAFLNAQVTIGSNLEPTKATLLDLKSQQAGANNNATTDKGGLLLPRVELRDPITLEPFVSTTDADWTDPARKAALTKSIIGLLLYNVGTSNGLEQGILVWTGSNWDKITTAHPWLNPVTTTPDLLKHATHEDDAIATMATVTIGAIESTAASAILDIQAENKGVLLPRVALLSNTDNRTIADPTVGTLVYNTGAEASYPFAGFMFWDGAHWKTLESATTAAPIVTKVMCAAAVLTPSTYKQGVAYNGTLSVPYQGGNGGIVPANLISNIISVNGLNFHLRTERLANGPGELIFEVSGTPTVTSPIGTVIPLSNHLTTANTIQLPFLIGGNFDCEVRVGEVSEATVVTRTVMGKFTYTSAAETGRNGYHFVATTPDGRFSFRIFVPSGSNFSTANIQIRGNQQSGTVTVASVEEVVWGSTASSAGAGGMSRNRMPVGTQWGGHSANSSNVSGTTGFTAQSSSNFPNWGDEGIYFSSNPEFRFHAFMPLDAEDKVFYKVSFMMALSEPTGAANASNCPNGTCGTTKAVIQIEQFTTE